MHAFDSRATTFLQFHVDVLYLDASCVNAFAFDSRFSSSRPYHSLRLAIISVAFSSPASYLLRWLVIFTQRIRVVHVFSVDSERDRTINDVEDGNGVSEQITNTTASEKEREKEG